MNDTSNIKLTEENFRETIGTITDQLLVGIGLLQDNKILYVNQKVCDLFGYSYDELSNWKIEDLYRVIHPDYLEEAIEYVNQILYDPNIKEIQYTSKGVKKSGEIFWAENLIKRININNRPALLGIFIDITNRRIVEEKYKKEKTILNNFIDLNPYVIAILDSEGHNIKRNEAFINFFKSIPPKEYIFFEDPIFKKAGYNNELKRARNGEIVLFPEIWYNPHLYDPQYPSVRICFRMIIWPIYSQNGHHIENYVITGEDITERKNTEQKLKESEQKYQDFISNSKEGIYRIDFSSEIDINLPRDQLVKLMKESSFIGEVNKAHAKMYKTTPENLIGKPLSIYIPDLEERIIKMLEAENFRYQNEYKDTDFLDNPIYIDDSFQAQIQDGKIVHVWGIQRNITDRKKAEKNLKESESKFKTIFESIPDLFFLLSEDTTILEYSGKSEDLYIPPEEFIGKKMYDILPSDVGSLAKKYVELTLKTKKPHIIEYQLPIKKELRYYEGRFLYFSKKTVAVFIRDISERKNADRKVKESEEKFRSITEQALMGIGILQDDRYQYVNSAFADIFGYTPEEIMSWEKLEYAKLIHPNDREMALEQARKKQLGLSDAIIHYKFRGITKNNKIKLLEIYSNSVIYRGRIADLISLVDITSKEELELLKKEFLDRTSHELKTPLISIKGYTELLLELYADRFDTNILSILSTIYNGCERLETIINKILESSQLTVNKLELNKIRGDLSYLIKSCVDDLSGLAKMRNISIFIKLHDELITEFESEKIHTVLSNLLINAIKYTQPFGEINIRSEILENCYLISVQDTGIGFTEEEKTRLFTQFGKIERYGKGWNVGIDGSGLGLFISKRIIELHNGKIWVESAGSNKGSTFYFTLPII